jgi:hypothetical protein
MANATRGRSLDQRDAASVLPRPPGDTPSPKPPTRRDCARWTLAFYWESIPPVEHPEYTYQYDAGSLDEALRWANNTIGTNPHKGLRRLEAWIADADGTWIRVQTRCDWISGGCA